MKSFKKFLKIQSKSEAGFSLVEIITVTLLMTMLITSAAIGLSVFFGKIHELTRWIELQEDAMECINSIKNGVSVGSGINQQYYGVANSRTMKFFSSGFGGSGGSSKLVCYPPSSSEYYSNDNVEFYFDGTFVRYRTVYAGSSSSNMYLFPERSKKDYIKITQFNMTKYNHGDDVKVIRLVLNARIETGEDKYRYIRFSTLMANRG